MEMKMRALLVCLIAACFVAAAHGFVRGDLVKTSTRARYGAVETSWTGLTAKFSPRYRYDKASLVPNPQQDIKAYDSFKLSFSFVDGKFVTPWITVWDAKQNMYLNYIEFVFMYSGNDIVGVDYHVDYNNDPEHGGKILSNLLIKFVWDEQSLEDVDSMLAFMLCGGFIVTMFMLLYALFDSQGATRLHKLTELITSEEEARPVPSSLPYVDTSSSYESHTPKRRGVGAGGNRSSSTTYVEYDNTRGPMAAMEGAGGFAPTSWAESQPSGVQGEEEIIPMEPLPRDEAIVADRREGFDYDDAGDSAPAMTEDFVSIDTSQLPSPAMASAPTYLQQPMARRKGQANTDGASSSSSSWQSDLASSSKND